MRKNFQAFGFALLTLVAASCQLTVNVPTGLPTPGKGGSPSPSVGPTTAPTTEPGTPPPPSYFPIPSARPSFAPTPGHSYWPQTPRPTYYPKPTPTPNNQQWTPTPYPSYGWGGGGSTIISGTVYNETGATVDGAIVKVNSLDASVPYTATTTTSQGSWVINNVPEGANVEIIAYRDGWTTRRRVGSFQTQANQKNIVDFGGTGGSGDVSGVPYFISGYPEIAAVDPSYDATNVDNTTVSYVVTLSEPFDSTNQNRLANAIRLFPANSYAAPDNDGSNGGAAYTDLKDQRISPFFSTGPLDRPVDADPSQGYAPTAVPNHPAAGAQPSAASNVPWDYSVKNGSLFLNDANTRANCTWDATGSVMTLTFNAPLIADRTNQARFQVGFVATSSTDRIVDKDNNQLGVDATGSQQNYPAVGCLVHGTIKQPDLSLNLPGGNDTPSLGNMTPGAARWVGTHQDAARFAVKVDNVDPQLVSVAYTRNLNTSSRFELTFQKPIAAYNGRQGGHVGDAIRNGTVLDMLSMCVSDRTGGTANVNLVGGQVPSMLDPNGSNFGAQSNQGQIEREFKLQGGSTNMAPYGTDIRSAEVGGMDGKYLLQVNPSNPRTLFVYVVNRASLFSPTIVELKVRAEGVTDPAGNTLKSSDADRQQSTSSVQ